MKTVTSAGKDHKRGLQKARRKVFHGHIALVILYFLSFFFLGWFVFDTYLLLLLNCLPVKASTTFYLPLRLHCRLKNLLCLVCLGTLCTTLFFVISVFAFLLLLGCQQSGKLFFTEGLTDLTYVLLSIFFGGFLRMGLWLSLR